MNYFTFQVIMFVTENIIYLCVHSKIRDRKVNYFVVIGYYSQYEIFHTYKNKNKVLE